MKENCKDTGGQPTNPTTPSKDREFVDGPATTDVPKDTTPIDSDDSFYDDEIIPVWAQDEVTDPGDYNIYYTCANSKAKRTMFWLWGWNWFLRIKIHCHRFNFRWCKKWIYILFSISQLQHILLLLWKLERYRYNITFQSDERFRIYRSQGQE